MTEATYAGLMLGGPGDGKRYIHETPRVTFPIAREVAVEVQPDEDPRTAKRFTYFDYQYFEAPWGGRYWIPLEIVMERTFEGKAYRDPFEYIMATLESGYRRGK